MDVNFAPDRPEFYLGDPHAAFRRLRSQDPVPWYPDGRFWCVTKHADLQRVSVTPKVFSSAQGTQLFEIPARQRGEINVLEDAPSIIRMDPPEHNRHRKLVIQAFTPRIVQALEPRIRELARASLDAVTPGEQVDFVEAVAIPTPMLVIAELLGVPSDDRWDFRRWSDAMIEAGGGGTTETTVATLGEVYGYFSEKIAERRRAPQDDLLSTLLAAEIDGQKLSDPEILIFCLTLLVAGNETVRNLVSVGAWTLLQHPDQKRQLVDDPTLIPNAVEELLRWVAPVQTFVRRATRDVQLRDKQIEKDDFVVLLYGSANRDEEVFGGDAECFDIRRSSASRHLSFGFGEHLCMGASLARMEARVLFEELLSQLPDFELSGPVERLSSVLMNGLVQMPVVFKK